MSAACLRFAVLTLPRHLSPEYSCNPLVIGEAAPA